jgi:hypothetical protein
MNETAGARNQEELLLKRDQEKLEGIRRKSRIRQVAFFYQKDNELANAVSRDANEVEFTPEEDVRTLAL